MQNVTIGCALLVVVDDIKEAVLGCVNHGRTHPQIVWVQVLEEVGVKVETDAPG